MDKKSHGDKYMKKTNKEQQLLQFIKEHLNNFGYPPTVREMCHAVKVSSTSTIAYYMQKLEQDGYIKKNPNKNRAIEIVDKSSNLTPITFSDTNDYIRIPLLGVVTAGQPILAVEQYDEYFMVSPNLFHGEGLFMLTVSGESMINAGIFDGDKVVIKQTPYAENGEIVAAMIDGYSTIKRFYKENGAYRLQPENDSMQPIYTDHVEILGKVVGLVRKF